MAFDFPNSPVNGTLFQPAGGPTYVYQNGVWMQATSSISLPTARSRNLVANPSAQISQENGSNVQNATGTFLADNWGMGASGISVQGVQGIGYGPSPDGSTTGVNFNASTAKPTLAASDYMYVHQAVEGSDMADLAWGTPSAKPVVVRFSARADAPGLYSFSIRNGNNDRSYLAGFQMTAAPTVWQTFGLPIPADTTGTWSTGATLGMRLGFCAAAGATLTGVLGWQAGGPIAVPGQVNSAATAGKNLVITDLGVYEDPGNTGLPPPFQRPDYTLDLLRCQRYWSSIRTAGPTGVYVGYVRGVPMRGTPTSVVTSGGATIVETGTTHMIFSMTTNGAIIATSNARM